MAAFQPAAEMITLSISALYESGPHQGHLHGIPFGNICKGEKDINACVTAPKLVTITLKILIPCIQDFCPHFTWHTEEFVVCDEAWVDLSRHLEPEQPHFYKDCLQPGSHKNSKGSIMFKSRQFPLYIVVPQNQWSEYELFMKNSDGDTSKLSLSAAHNSTQLSKTHNSTHQCLLSAPSTFQYSPSPSPKLSDPSSHHAVDHSPSKSTLQTSALECPISQDIVKTLHMVSAI
ncbi:hypothetical protein ID866_11231 [Astraeus odoratus]|nr:hypothetical protein ID866_11231 [Astraeus odoratus]